jgi:hypothetical protein
MSHEIHAFTDSNVFLHYKPLAQIDWCRVLKARSVVLVICLPVIQELDNKKSDPRLADRARRAIKEIEEHEAAAKPLRSGVTLEVYNEELRRDEFPSSLSPDSQDDRIVHLARKYMLAHVDRKVCIVTEDYGMSLRCRAGDVLVERIDGADRLENPGEEKDRKLKQALNELAVLKNRLPKLIVSVHRLATDYGEDGPYTCKLTDNWADLNVKVEVEKQRKAHPKRADQPAPPFPMPISEMWESRITQEQWERYDREIDAYLLNYELFTRQMNTWGSNHSRTIRFILFVENQGNSPATDIDLYLSLPKKISWVAQVAGQDSGVQKKPTPPTPPQPPKPDFISAALRSASHGALAELNLPGLRDIRPTRNADEPEVQVYLRHQHGAGALVHTKLTRLKHGQVCMLGNFVALFGSWDEVSPFEAEYTVSASEIPEKLDEKIPFVITKSG